MDKFYAWARGKYVQFYLVDSTFRENLIECKVCGEVAVVPFGVKARAWAYHHLNEYHEHVITLYVLAHGKIDLESYYADASI
jgi:hypothetical protein